MVIDKWGNAYIVGISNNANGGFAVAKYYPSGGAGWSRIYNNNILSCTHPSITVDSSGNVYVASVAEAPNPTFAECRIVKYDSAGTYQWMTSLDTAKTGSGLHTDIVVDKLGYPYVTYSKKSPTSTFTDYAISKLNPLNGSEIWEAIYNGTISRNDDPIELAVDTMFDVFVTGKENATGTNYTTTIKYSQNVGINELSPGSGISYFPNPFSENLTITSKNGFHSANLTLYNSLGEKVMEKSNSSGSQLNLSRNNLPAGIYFIRITDGEKCFSGKVIIQ
jgi:hypothetical protein